MNNKPMKFDSNGIYATSPELSKIALQVLEQERRNAWPAAVLLSERVTFGDMVRGVTDEGDFDVTSQRKTTTAAVLSVTDGELSTATAGAAEHPL